jgi:G3E family GTPase
MTKAHVITGSFGSGKTTAIRWLMAHKPEHELWMVILNEFTDAGLDAVSVAAAARGRYDVRLVAGGCLCCVGELEFSQQLRDILRNFKPARLLIEPSGAGHAADIVDTLGIYETQQALHLDSVICLVDALDANRILHTRSPHEWSQIQSADVLLLSKPDLAGEPERQAFTISPPLSIRRSAASGAAATANCRPRHWRHSNARQLSPPFATRPKPPRRCRRPSASPASSAGKHNHSSSGCGR